MTPEVQTILHLLSGSALCCKGKDGHGHGDHVVSVTHPDGTVTSAIVMGGGGVKIDQSELFSCLPPNPLLWPIIRLPI